MKICNLAFQHGTFDIACVSLALPGTSSCFNGRIARHSLASWGLYMSWFCLKHLAYCPLLTHTVNVPSIPVKEFLSSFNCPDVVYYNNVDTTR